jgi:geranylgeranyl pyrophosphate synthase
LGLDVDDRSVRGKRLRPALTLLTGNALGGDERQAMPFALAIELMHNFALVHDDIEDGDEVRRNRPAIWIEYGLPHAINIGDYYFCKVYEALLTEGEGALSDATRLRLIALMTETLEHTHRGQALDMNARLAREFTTEDYLEIVTEKTGYYLAAPILGGAIVAGASPEILAAIAQYGQCLGPLFQIVDDIIDLTTGKGRGEVGSDIREGKRSYLVAVALPNCSPDQRERLFAILDKPRAETTTEEVEWAIELYRRTGALDEAHRYCRELREKCHAAVAPCPQPLRELLTIVADYLVDRQQ